MRELFALFYAVMFGAHLSAEIGTYGLFNLQARATNEWMCRVFFLVVARSLFFAFVYVLLPEALSANVPTAILQVVTVLALCLPIIGFQHISYLMFKPHQVKLTGPRSTAIWWTTAVVTMLTCVGFIGWLALTAK